MMQVPANSPSKETLDFKNLASPLYSKAAKFLRKDWIVKQKLIDNIGADQSILRTKEFA
jgi:hypothetical protein